MSSPSDPSATPEGRGSEPQPAAVPESAPRAEAGNPADTPDSYSPPEPTAKKPRPWGWIAACVLLVVVAGGLAIWALGLNSDLDDQKVQTVQAKQEAEQANSEVDELSGQVDDITQTVNDASDALSQAGQDAQNNAQSALDGLKAKLATLKEKLQAAAGSDTADADAGGSETGSADATPAAPTATAPATPTETPTS